MDPVAPRAEVRSMPRVPADAIPPHVHRVPPASASHPRRNLTLGLAGLGILVLVLLAALAM